MLQDSLLEERFQPVVAPPSLSSFKRAAAPTMAGRPVDQRRQEDRRSRSKGALTAAPAGSGAEKSSSRGSSSGKVDQRRVGQLDERNLKRAAHRYGTLPKGARIGAYLESLRASGLTPEPVLSDGGGGESGHDTLDSQRSGHTDPGPGAGGRIGSGDPPGGPLLLHPAQPPGMINMMMMARSNSSHGGFPGAASGSAGGPQSSHGGHHSRPAGPRSGQLPRRLPTYTQGSAPLRAGSGGKASALLDLDFPPPPAEQPEDNVFSSPASSFHPQGGGHHQLFLPSSPSVQQRLLRSGRDQSPDSCSSERLVGSATATSPLPILAAEAEKSLPVMSAPSFTTFSHQQQQLVSEMMVQGSTPPLPASSPLPPPVDQVHTRLFLSPMFRIRILIKTR